MRKLTALFLSLVMVFSVTACGGQSDTITVCSREDGSGTRGAFIEIFGIEEKDAQGNKVDKTTIDAEITNSTAVMLQTVAGNRNAIGYVSLGSLSDSVTAADIDGAKATVENVKNGSYKVSRPFNIVTNGEAKEEAADFIKFIMSAEGQAIVEGAGYISEGSTGAYEKSNVSGKVVVAGSSSVTPVMEKLAEGYKEATDGRVEVEVHMSDSSTGVTSVLEGICDIGMASRAIKDSEKEKGAEGMVIAIDGIAVIVNNNNSVKSLTSEEVKAIFKGEVTSWTEMVSE